MSAGTTILLAAGSTRTAEIEQITAAGSDPRTRAHTPSVDAEICRYGAPASRPGIPTGPNGTPTPALVTRAVIELVDADCVVADAGLSASTAAPTVSVDAQPGEDVRTPEPVPNARRVIRNARALGRRLPTSRLVIGETIPAGTTTALGVLAALGERETVSSSLPENPIERKRSIVEEGLAAAGIERGDCAGEPIDAVRLMGDPVLAAVYGVADGALAAGRDVMLGGGTQLATAAALLAHGGRTDLPTLATTSFLAADSADVAGLAASIGVSLRVTDPAFDDTHPATAGYVAGVAKEGVAMGGALALAEERDVPLARVRDRLIDRYETLVETPTERVNQ